MLRFFKRSKRLSLAGQILKDIDTKHTGVLAAGSAYFIVLSFFPFLAAAVALSSLVLSSGDVDYIFQNINSYLPADIASLVTSQLAAAQDNKGQNVVFAILAILIALFSVSGGVDNITRALSAVYGAKRKRNFIQARIRGGLMTLGLIALVVLIGLLLSLNGILLSQLGLPDWLAAIGSSVRWVVIILMLFGAMGVLYRYGPDRKPGSKTPWFTVGAGVAVILSLVFTFIFFVYARYFASFSDTYSFFAGVIVLMLWYNLLSFAILIGAHFDVIKKELTIKELIAKIK